MLKKTLVRLKRKIRVRVKISWTPLRPRLAVYRSNANIYAQLIDDTTGNVLCASSDMKMKKEGNKIEMAKKVGEDIAKVALEKWVNEIVFDRGGFLYHGRVKALAEWARAGWLKF